MAQDSTDQRVKPMSERDAEDTLAGVEKQRLGVEKEEVEGERKRWKFLHKDIKDLFKREKDIPKYRRAPELGTESIPKSMIIFTYLIITLYYLIFYVLDLNSTLYLKIGVNIILMFFVYMSASDREQLDAPKWFVFIAMFELFLPFIFTSVKLEESIEAIRFYLFNPYIFPVWLLYVIFCREKHAHREDKTSFPIIYLTIMFFLIMFGILSYVSELPSFEKYNQPLDAKTQQQLKEKGGEVYIKGAEGTGNFLTNFLNSMKEWNYKMTLFWENRLSYATGEQYYGQEQETEKPELSGVSVTNLKPGADLFRRNENIFISAMVTASNLYKDAPVNVLVKCYEGKKDDAKIERDAVGNVKRDYGTLRVGEKGAPKGNLVEGLTDDEKRVITQFRLLEKTPVDIDCKFPTGFAKFTNSTAKQSFTVNVDAAFPFETVSTAPLYVIDEKRYLTYRDETGETREEKILEDVPEIKSFDSVAIFTPGPVELGQPERKLISIHEASDEQDATFFTVGGTIRTKGVGKGVISKIMDIIIAVPKGIVLVGTKTSDGAPTYECTHFFEPLNENADVCVAREEKNKGGAYQVCTLHNDPTSTNEKEQKAFKECLKDECEMFGTKYNAYRLKAELYKDFLKDIKEHYTFSCRAEIESKEVLLEKSKIVTKRDTVVKARYWYSVSESTQVNVKTADVLGITPIAANIEKTPGATGPGFTIENKVIDKQNIPVKTDETS